MSVNLNKQQVARWCHWGELLDIRCASRRQRETHQCWITCGVTQAVNVFLAVSFRETQIVQVCYFCEFHLSLCCCVCVCVCAAYQPLFLLLITSTLKQNHMFLLFSFRIFQGELDFGVLKNRFSLKGKM